jgi:hypothetical protein
MPSLKFYCYHTLLLREEVVIFLRLSPRHAYFNVFPSNTKEAFAVPGKEVFGTDTGEASAETTFPINREMFDKI